MEDYLIALSYIENDVIEFSAFSNITETAENFVSNNKVKASDYQQINYEK